MYSTVRWARASVCQSVSLQPNQRPLTRIRGPYRGVSKTISLSWTAFSRGRPPTHTRAQAHTGKRAQTHKYRAGDSEPIDLLRVVRPQQPGRPDTPETTHSPWTTARTCIGAGRARWTGYVPPPAAGPRRRRAARARVLRECREGPIGGHFGRACTGPPVRTEPLLAVLLRDREPVAECACWCRT